MREEVGYPLLSSSSPFPSFLLLFFLLDTRVNDPTDDRTLPIVIPREGGLRKGIHVSVGEEKGGPPVRSLFRYEGLGWTLIFASDSLIRDVLYRQI